MQCNGAITLKSFVLNFLYNMALYSYLNNRYFNLGMFTDLEQSKGLFDYKNKGAPSDINNHYRLICIPKSIYKKI